MKHAAAFLAALSLWPAAAPAQGNAQTNTPTNTGGTLDPIWRNEPVIGIWLSGGQGLIEVPAYLDGTDFPYARRPYPREVPFADRLTVVRLLGGWDKRDLGKGESTDYDTIAQGDLVTRPFGAPTLRTTDLVDLGPLTCDRQAGRCTGQLEWDMPGDGSGGGHLLITADDRLHICATADGTRQIDWFEIGTQYTISVQEVESCPAEGAATGHEIATLTVDPSQLDYHFDLMKRRLDPYVAQGYTDLTLVLDNIPWALPHDPTTGTYGQTAPPSSLAEWSDFVDRLVQALIDDYGAETVADFRFRLGTEQQSERRFSGTPQQYLALYEDTVKAIHAHLPDARIGPFNQAGSSDDPTALTYAFLYDNIADPGDIDFIAHSLYFIPKMQQDVLTNVHMAQRLPDYEALWRALPRAPGTTIEFQEFGVLRNQDGLATGEPGARGAALHVSDIFSMLVAGVDGLWHWQPFERLLVRGLGVDTQVLSGRGWLYLVLEHFAGGQIYPLSHAAPEAPDTEFTAHFIDTDADDLILVSTFNPDQARDSTDPRRVTVEVPKELIPNPDAVTFTQVSLSQDTAVYDRIRADLDREGLLKKDFAAAPGQPAAGIMAMGGARGRRYVAQNWDGYRDAITRSLKKQPVSPDITAGSDTYRFTLDIPAPSVLALVLTAP
ncbi:Beta-xylosidase (plasmid) [Marinibacterium anthonyi]|nr:Beta-xylosidase [Marinibacterium anthonyi]